MEFGVAQVAIGMNVLPAALVSLLLIFRRVDRL